jgi:hypothetical protein
MPTVLAQPAISTTKSSRVYVPAALLIVVLAFVGFWPTYFGPLFTGQLNAIPLIHLHAAVYVTWLALFIAQAAFAATGRLPLHVRLGPWIMAFGVLVVAMGLVLAFDRFGAQVAAGHLAVAQRKLFGPVRDMLFFTPFLAAGWFWRRKPQIHKRLMIVATTILLVAAVGRMSFLGRPVPETLFMLVWPLPVYIAMIHDYVTKKLVHPVYVLGVIAMLVMRLCLPLRKGPAWLEFSSWLAGFYA